MRRMVLLVGAVLLVGLAVPASAARPAKVPEQLRPAVWARLAQLQAQGNAPQSIPESGTFTVKDDAAIRNVFHPAGSGNGIATAETWADTDWESFSPVDQQGVVRGVRVHRVTRIAVRVELYSQDGGPGTPSTLLASSPTVNSGTARTATAMTPEVSLDDVPGGDPCITWKRAYLAIRWDVGTLTSTQFDSVFTINLWCLVV